MADDVDYVVVGEREETLAEGDVCLVGGEVTFRSADGEVLIYELRAE
jgi:hypothetical protein